MGRSITEIPHGEILGESYLIFVTIGTSSWNFNRLISHIDNFIAPNIEERIIIQIGLSNYIPKNCEWFRKKNKEEMNQYYYGSRLVICHAAIGSIISARRFNKPIIIVPRRKKYDELLDDHQIQLAEALQNDPKIKVVWDEIELMKFVSNTSRYIDNSEIDNRLIKNIQKYINDI